MDTASAPRKPADLWRVRILERTEGAGVVLVRGIWDGREVRLLLPDEGGRGGDVKVGGLLGIRAPTWEVEVERVGWVVAPDWRGVDECGG